MTTTKVREAVENGCRIFGCGKSKVIMLWTSISDRLPEEGVECLLSCMKADGALVELIGYLQDGKWVIEANDPEQNNVTVRHWRPFAAERKVV